MSTCIRNKNCHQHSYGFQNFMSSWGLDFCFLWKGPQLGPLGPLGPKSGYTKLHQAQEKSTNVKNSRELGCPFENPGPPGDPGALGAPGASGAPVASKSGDPFHKKKVENFMVLKIPNFRPFFDSL